MTGKKAPARLIQRTISGRGIVKVPYDATIRRLVLYLNVLRLPRIDFSNSKWNPDRSEYAKFTWMRGDYILREDALHYEHQRFVWDVDPSGYLAKALLCQYTRTTQRLTALAVGLNLPPLPEASEIFIEPIADMPDVIKIVCRDDTAIDADLWKYEYDIACTEANTPPPPSDPPPPRSKVPVAMPIGDISPPYATPNDGGDTIPHPGDESVPPEKPPQGVVCAFGEVAVRLLKFDQTYEDRTYPLVLPFYDVYLRYVQAAPGQDYQEHLMFQAAPQNFDTCNNGQRTLVDKLLRLDTPMYQSVILISVNPT